MKPTILLAMACVFAAIFEAHPLSASVSPCTSQTLENLVLLGSSGCSEGNLLLSDFTVRSSLADPQALLIAPSQVFVSFVNSGSFTAIQFSSPQAATAPSLYELYFGFQATGFSNAVGLGLNGATAAGDGVALSFLQICAGGTYDSAGNCSADENTLAAFQDVTGTGDLSVTTGIQPAVARLGFIDGFSVDGGRSGSAFAEGSTITISSTPEPSFFVALGLALAAMAIYRKRSKYPMFLKEESKS